VDEIENVTIGGSDKDRLVPLQIGIDILGYLKHNFPTLLDVSFTADMEASLDKIERNERDKLTVLREFYEPFSATVNAIKPIASSRERSRDLTPFLKWSKLEEISETDRRALESLPQPIGKTKHRVMLGPYGVYVRTSEGKNKRLDPRLWPKVVAGTLSPEDLQD
jgi:hypothetical protein